MNCRRRVKVAFLFGLLIGLGIQAVSAQEAACEALVQQALDATGSACQGGGRNEVCYGNVLLEAQTQPGFEMGQFSQPGDTTAIAGIQQLKLSSLNVTTNQWGIAEMQVQANVPGALPGQNLAFLLFGDVTIDNQVLTIPVHVRGTQALNVRLEPSTDGKVIEAWQPGEEATALARLADGIWVEVRLADGKSGWVFAILIDAAMPLDDLKIAEAGMPIYGPMQAIVLKTGFGDAACADAPDSGLMIQTPEGSGEISFQANAVNVTIGSTVYLQTDERTAGQFEWLLSVIEGQAQVEAAGVTRIVPAGGRVRVALDANGLANGAPSAVEAYPMEAVQALPIHLLARAIAIAPPLSDQTLEATAAPAVPSTPSTGSPVPLQAVEVPTACSVTGDISITLHFVNNTDRVVDMYWISYDCQETFYYELQPGEFYDQQTFVTHPWVIRDVETGTPLAALVAEQDATVTIGGD